LQVFNCRGSGVIFQENFALSVAKAFQGCLGCLCNDSGLVYILALVICEASAADDCWTHDVLAGWEEIGEGKTACECFV